MHFVRPHPHLGLLDRVVPVGMVEVPKLDRRDAVSDFVSVDGDLIYDGIQTYTARPMATPNQSPSNFQPRYQPVEKEMGSAMR